MKMYKYVSNELKSLIMDEDNAGLEVQYKIGEFVEADTELYALGYGLCVFSKLLSSDRTGSDCRLFEVEVEGVFSELPTRFSCVQVTKTKILEKLLEECGEWVTDTVMVRAVKLVREIHG
jgi:hypothetical protein